jgi:ferredoxin
VQCGICVHVCPENALKQRGAIHLDQETFIDHQLARAEPMICRECGKAFGTRQSFDRVMDILRDRDGQDDLKLYEYCDTCRVRKLYEDGQ